MAIIVIRVGLPALEGEVEEAVGPAAAEVCTRFKAGIDHRDADLVAVVPALREGEGRDEQIIGLRVLRRRTLRPAVGRDHSVDRDGLHVRIVFEPAEIVAMYGRRERVEASMLGHDLVAVLLQAIGEGRGSASGRSYDDALLRWIALGGRLLEHAIELGWLRLGGGPVSVMGCGVRDEPQESRCCEPDASRAPSHIRAGVRTSSVKHGSSRAPINRREGAVVQVARFDPLTGKTVSGTGLGTWRWERRRAGRPLLR